MANITNRSKWLANPLVKGVAPKEFRLKSQALTFLAEFGHTDPSKLTTRHLKQYANAFEVQIKLKDRTGQVVQRSDTFPTHAEAAAWAKKEEAEILSYRERHGGFVADFENITVREALTKFHEQHYAGKRSKKEVGYRIAHLAEWLGETKRLRALNRIDFIGLRDRLSNDGYSASSIRNYFTVLTSFYKHAVADWQYPVENLAADLRLPKPNNYKQRSWMGDEHRRLMSSIQTHRPWLEPIVRLSLAMAFRRGEIVQGPKDSKTGQQSGGLRWEDIDWEKQEITLPREKNDNTKAVTEQAGRSAPLTSEIESILRPLYEQSTTKSGLIFATTTNTVTKAFREACERADPPITNLTFHSLRKIATKKLSSRVSNPMELSRLTGHRSLDVLNRRYFDVSTSELRAKLEVDSKALLQRGVGYLTAGLGHDDAKQFIELIRSLPTTEAAFTPPSPAPKPDAQ